MSDFDDLLNFDGSTSQSNQGSSDPFDPFGSGQTANQNEGSGGALLDLGFDAQVSLFLLIIHPFAVFLF
jgi:hypothetical protein